MEKGKIRIIGGKWKGKKIPFSIDPKLRPTPDRAKEMVFNWLGNDLSGLSCLDLFAGTGAMGIEALSRGAIKIDFVETEKNFALNLQSTLKSLKENTNTKVYNEDFRKWFNQIKSGHRIYYLLINFVNFLDFIIYFDLVVSIFL